MMTRNRPEQTAKPVRRLRLERREARARRRGWVGPWPPDKPRIDSPADCEQYLSRLERGEQRAGLLTALASDLVAFFEHLKPEHFQRFARVLLDVAQNPKASHRSRLRAVQAAIRPLRQAVTILPKLEKAGEPSLQAHLESLLIAFCRELSPDGFARLAAVLVELAGPAAKTTSDKLRACEVALTAVTDAMVMLSELGAMRRPQAPCLDIPKMRELMERSAREIDEIRAETKARMEKDWTARNGPAPGPPASDGPGGHAVPVPVAPR